MRKIITLSIFLLLLLLSGCVSKNKYEEILAENEELNNGAPRLFAQIELAYESTNYMEVKNIFTNLENRHPASGELKNAKVIYEKIIKFEKVEIERLRILAEKEEKSV